MALTTIQTLLTDLTREQQKLDALKLTSDDAKKLRHTLSDGLFPTIQALVETVDESLADVGAALAEVQEELFEDGDFNVDEEFLEGVMRVCAYLDSLEAIEPQMRAVGRAITAQCLELLEEEDDGRPESEPESNQEAEPAAAKA